MEKVEWLVAYVIARFRNKEITTVVGTIGLIATTLGYTTVDANAFYSAISLVASIVFVLIPEKVKEAAQEQADKDQPKA